MARIQVNGTQSLYFEHHRGAGVPVVLIHGWAMSGRIWAGTVEALKAKGHAVITVDLRGCGQSDRDFPTMSIAELAADVAGIVHQTTSSPVVLNGWSLGGAVATQAAEILGKNAAGLILTCGASPRFTKTDDFPYGGEPGALAASVAALASDRAGFFRSLAEGVCALPVSAATIDWMWSAFVDSGPNVIDQLVDLGAIDQRQTLANLTTPVLSLVGSADAILDPQVGIAASKIAKNGQLVTFDNCGHAPFVECPADYYEALNKFLGTL